MWICHATLVGYNQLPTHEILTKHYFFSTNSVNYEFSTLQCVLCIVL